MRTLAIGDIHGCLTALRRLEEFVAIRPDDRVIVLGDYIDRGPNSRGVVDWVIDRTLSGQCVPLLGNHEIMMLDALGGHMRMDDWLNVGGRETLQSYAIRGRTPHPRDVHEAHIRFLSQELLRVYETETHIFAHAFINSELSLREQPEWSLFWENCDGMARHFSGKQVIVGHTSQRSGVPLNGGHFVCIDTRAYGGSGWLTCLDVDSGQYWQANQRGETRSDWLEEPHKPDT